MGLEPFRFQISMLGAYKALDAYERLGEEKFQEATKRAAQRAGLVIQMTMQELILYGYAGWGADAENHPFTLSEKDTTGPLFDSGQLADSVDVVLVESARDNSIDAYIGFSDPQMSMLALILEFGKSLVVTDRMRRHMAARGLKLKADTTVIFIPPRPFFEPSFDLNKDKLRAIATEEIERAVAELNLDAGSEPDWIRKFKAMGVFV